MEPQDKHGHDRLTINENLMYEPAIQEEIINILNTSFSRKESPAKQWMHSNKQIKHYLLQQTAIARKKKLTENDKLAKKINILTNKQQESTSTSSVPNNTNNTQEEEAPLKKKKKEEAHY